MRRCSPVLRPTWRVGVVFLSLGALIGAGMTVFAQAPPDATIPRVPNPPLAAIWPTYRATCGRSRCRVRRI